MDIPINVTFRNVPHSDAATARIREKAEALARFYDRMTSCRVVVESRHHSRHKGNLYGVHIELGVPGEKIVVSHDGRKDTSHADLYVAIRDAFDATKRRLEDYARKRRGEVKAHEGRARRIAGRATKRASA